MQVTETSAQGLKHEYQVVVPKTELGTRADERLGDLKTKVQIRGFRPGKVPVDHLRKVYGRSVMAETIEAAVRDANSKIVTDNNFKLAAEPKVTLPEDPKTIEAVISGEADLSYTVSLEVMPKIELADFKNMKLEKLVAEVSDEEIDEAMKRIAEQNKPYVAKADGAKAEQGDRLTVNFVGRVDGKEFDGGKAEDVAVNIGAGQFIPGFEEQLVGFAVGDNKTIQVKFPEGYANADLAGKDAEFDVTVKGIESAGAVTIDDTFATSLGMESLDKLKDAVRQSVQQGHNQASRQRLKRQLLDNLDKMHQFEPPQSLVEDEFNNVWKQVQDDLKSQARTFADEGTTEEAAREEYRKIAERRVRLGLVVAEIGERNKIQVSDEEVNRAVVERLRQFPGQEREVYEFYKKNPQALASIRAPIFEEKVVDFVSELGQVTEKKVSRAEIEKAEEEDSAKALADAKS